MVARRDERITRMALGSANLGGRLKSGDDAPQFIETIKLDAIDPDPDQPRRHFDGDRLAELADSLVRVGQLQPVILIRTGDRFRLHVGERRWRASLLAGLATIRAIVRDTPPEAQAARIAQIVENEQRADLSVTEMIDAVRELQAGGLKNGEIASALSRPPSRISELQALGEAPAELTAMIDTLGLGLSYQLLRQWRQQPQAALDFLAQMPVEHISRVTIATIGQALSPDIEADEEPGELTSTPVSKPAYDANDRAGEGASPRGSETSPRSSRSAAPGPDGGQIPDPRPTLALVGGLVVEHDAHGAGRVVFGREAPPDHLVVRFTDEAPITLHKDEIRILAAPASDGLTP